MRKLFFAICFNLLLCGVCLARITPISEYDGITQQKPQKTVSVIREVSYQKFKEFFKNSLKKATLADPNNINRQVSYIPSQLQIEKEEEKQKSFFDKIYEQAIARVSNQEQSAHARQDIAPFTKPSTADVASQQSDWSNNNIPTIQVFLPPKNTPFSVPAKEHIPYLMNMIEVLPSGLVKFEETIVVVANGQKLKGGLTKILPLKVFNPDGKEKKLDYSIINVTLNDTPVDYRLKSDNNNNALLIPSEDFELPSGVYTYKFEYLVDNLLWEYDNYYQLYWDIGGNGWNLVVDRLGAGLHIPKINGLLAHQVLLGSPLNLQSNSVNIMENGPTATAYIASRPLFVGEGMHLIANIDKQALLPVSLWQRIVRLFYDYGDICISILGFLVIALSFVVSWGFITSDKSAVKLALAKTAITIRFLCYNTFDARSVCGYLLELYKKNIIDIEQSGETILLIKRTDNLKSLSRYEQKALKRLFGPHDTTYSITKPNILPLKRFASVLEKGFKRQMQYFRLKLNLGYFIFSASMLFVAEFFISFLSLNPLFKLAVLGLTSVICLFAMLLWTVDCRRWLKITLRLLSIDIILGCLVAFSAVINPFAAIFIMLSVAAIVVALEVYSKRYGLIKFYVRDMAKQKDYLLEHRDTILLGKDFLNNQSAIWAFEIENEFAPYCHAKYNKLSTMTEIMRILKK